MLCLVFLSPVHFGKVDAEFPAVLLTCENRDISNNISILQLPTRYQIVTDIKDHQSVTYVAYSRIT